MTIRTAVLTLALVLLWPLYARATESMPTRGMTMTQVKNRFGPPERIRAPVGQPPITRWSYPGFTVYFERDLTLDTVINQPHPTKTTSAADTPATVATQDTQGPARRADGPTHPKADRRETFGDDGRPAPRNHNGTAPPTPRPAHGDPVPTEPPAASGGGESSEHTKRAPASSAIRAERRQEEASSQFRFNPQSGRIEIVNDAKNDGTGKDTDSGGEAAGSAATDGRSTQPATDVSAQTRGTDTVAQPKNAPAPDGGKRAQ